MRWWKEALFILSFYLAYGQVRNQLGSDGLFAVTTDTAAKNAERVIAFEKRLGLFF